MIWSLNGRTHGRTAVGAGPHVQTRRLSSLARSLARSSAPLRSALLYSLSLHCAGAAATLSPGLASESASSPLPPSHDVCLSSASGSPGRISADWAGTRAVGLLAVAVAPSGGGGGGGDDVHAPLLRPSPSRHTWLGDGAEQSLSLAATRFDSAAAPPLTSTS